MIKIKRIILNKFNKLLKSIKKVLNLFILKYFLISLFNIILKPFNFIFFIK